MQIHGTRNSLPTDKKPGSVHGICARSEGCRINCHEVTVQDDKRWLAVGSGHTSHFLLTV